MTVTKDTLASLLKLWSMKNEFCGYADRGRGCTAAPGVFIKLYQPYSITVKLKYEEICY